MASADIGLIVRSFFSSPRALSRASLVSLVFLIRCLELGRLVLAVLELAQLLLDRLHLLVEVVLALRLLHLPLDAGADALFHLQDGDLALHEAVEPLQALGQAAGLEQLLLVGDLQRQMRRHGVGELRRIVDLRQRDQDLGRHLLVELHILLELGHHRAHQRLGLAHLALGLGQRPRPGPGRSADCRRSCLMRARALPSTSTLTVPSGSFSSCSTLETVPTR